MSLLIDLMHEYMASPEAIKALSGPLCGFHLSASERVSRNAYMTVIGLHMASNAYEALRCLASKDFRGHLVARFASKFDVAFTKRMLTIPEFEPLKAALPCLLFWTLPTVVKNIQVHRRGKWWLAFDEHAMIDVVRRPVVEDRQQYSM